MPKTRTEKCTRRPDAVRASDDACLGEPVKHIAKLRQVGDVVMLALLTHILERLSLLAGAQVDLEVEKGRLLVTPSTFLRRGRGRYTMDKLLDEAEASSQYLLPADQREWLDAKPVGRELL